MRDTQVTRTKVDVPPTKGLATYGDWITAKVAAGTGGNRAQWAREMLKELSESYRSLAPVKRAQIRDALKIG